MDGEARITLFAHLQLVIGSICSKPLWTSCSLTRTQETSPQANTNHKATPSNSKQAMGIAKTPEPRAREKQPLLRSSNAPTRKKERNNTLRHTPSRSRRFRFQPRRPQPPPHLLQLLHPRLRRTPLNPPSSLRVPAQKTVHNGIKIRALELRS